MKKYFFLGIGTIILWIFVVYLINIYVLGFSRENYFTKVSMLTENEVGLVFWASVLNNGLPSDILKDRLQVAANAYKQWKIKQIIVSWDNRIYNYNEPEVMKKYLISLWVESGHIHPDYAGFDTYDSIYRARDLFFVTEITLFTQDFHLKRAMYISKRLWINTTGLQTNLQKYLADDYNKKREVFARVKAFLDVEIFKSNPKYLWDSLRITPKTEIEEIKKELLEE
jgi:SanA protein